MAMVQGLRGQTRLALRELKRVLPLLAQERDHASWTVSCAAKALEHIRQGDAEMALHEVQRALAADWALWSGLLDRPPWPAADHEALALRCQSAGLSLVARPLAALAACRMVQAGGRNRAEPWLVSVRAPEFLDRLHAATPWAALFGAQALRLAGEGVNAPALTTLGADWLRRTARASVPDAFRDSFLQRSPVNRALLTLAAQR